MFVKILLPSFLLIFLVILELVLIGIGPVDGIDLGDLEKTDEDKEDIPKQVKYDNMGRL
jgi:hypothetical protein